jgi:pyruvate-formate lyase-activating enzyme
MLGCDLHCGYCQNWLTSQALRDEASLSPPHDATAEQLVALAKRSAAPVMVSTYNEPLITSEWAVDGLARAREAGITCGFVSNGNATRRVLDYLRPTCSSTRWTSRASGRRVTASWGDAFPGCWTRSATCTRWASGSRS